MQGQLPVVPARARPVPLPVWRPLRAGVMLPVTLALLAGCNARNGGAAWPSLAPRAGEAMPMVVRRTATQHCARPAATGECAPDAPDAPDAPAVLPTRSPAQLEAALATLEASIGAAETAVHAAHARATAAPAAADPASPAGAAAAVAAGQADLARAPLAGIAIRAAELAQQLRDNPAGAALQPQLEALITRIDALFLTELP